MSLCMLLCDILILLVVGFEPGLLRRYGSPPIRGFYCDDETIRYPYMESTVSITALYVVGIGLSLLIIVLTEIILARNKTNDDPVYFLKMRIPLWIVNTYKFFSVYFFGGASVQVISQGATFTIGRLRPNFIDVCVPDVNCTSPELQFKYITNYTCMGTSPEKILDSRRSFPSGHACYSAFAAFYMVFYIQRRWNIKGSHFLKPVVQLGCIVLCWATSLSRIHDNQHHWSDVAVGLILGITTAVFAAKFMAKLIKSHNEERMGPTFLNASTFKD